MKDDAWMEGEREETEDQIAGEDARTRGSGEKKLSTLHDHGNLQRLTQLASKTLGLIESGG